MAEPSIQCQTCWYPLYPNSHLLEYRLDCLNERHEYLDDAGDVDPDGEGEVDAEYRGNVEYGLSDAHDDSDDDESHGVSCSQ